MEQTSQRLQLAVSKILDTLGLPALESFSEPEPGVRFDSSEASRYSSNVFEKEPAGMAMTRENSQDRNQNGMENDALVAAPMGTLYEVTKLRNLRSNPRPHFNASRTSLPQEDFISKNKIDKKEAEELFSIFRCSLNQYLWGGIALVHTDLASVRASSSLLLTAILTVTALHIPGKEGIFDICYSEFLALVCDTMLDRYHTLDGIRGLCIGAFWLSDVSCE
jgi:hypothetical protein